MLHTTALDALYVMPIVAVFDTTEHLKVGKDSITTLPFVTVTYFLPSYNNSLLHYLSLNGIELSLPLLGMSGRQLCQIIVSVGATSVHCPLKH